jgi:hypothetical protein
MSRTTKADWLLYVSMICGWLAGTRRLELRLNFEECRGQAATAGPCGMWNSLFSVCDTSINGENVRISTMSTAGHFCEVSQGVDLGVQV